MKKLKNNFCNLALQTFHCEKEDVEFTSQGVKNLKTNELLTLKELALKAMCGNNIETQKLQLPIHLHFRHHLIW